MYNYRVGGTTPSLPVACRTYGAAGGQLLGLSGRRRRRRQAAIKEYLCRWTGGQVGALYRFQRRSCGPQEAVSRNLRQ